MYPSHLLLSICCIYSLLCKLILQPFCFVHSLICVGGMYLYFVICTPCCAPWLRRAVRFQEMRRLYTLAHLGFFLRGVTLGNRASEANEIWGGLGLRENEIWAFVSIIITWNRLPRHGGLTSHASQPPDPPLLFLPTVSAFHDRTQTFIKKDISFWLLYKIFYFTPTKLFYFRAAWGYEKCNLYVCFSVCLSVCLSFCLTVSRILLGRLDFTTQFLRRHFW